MSLQHRATCGRFIATLLLFEPKLVHATAWRQLSVIACLLLHKLVLTDDVGALAAFLVSDLAKSLTGGTIYIDGGYNIVN